MRSQQWFVLTLGLFAVGTGAAAQEILHEPALPAGAIVRLTWPGASPERVRLLAPLALTADTVWFCRYPTPACWVAAPHDTLRRPRRGLVGIERRQGNQARHGAAVGAIAGSAAALLYLVGTAEGREAGHGGAELAFVVSSGLIWAGLGALIGSGHDRWVPAQ
jgi:hypothetical protein